MFKNVFYHTVDFVDSEVVANYIFDSRLYDRHDLGIDHLVDNPLHTLFSVPEGRAKSS